MLNNQIYNGTLRNTDRDLVDVANAGCGTDDIETFGSRENLNEFSDKQFTSEEQVKMFAEIDLIN